MQTLNQRQLARLIQQRERVSQQLQSLQAQLRKTAKVVAHEQGLKVIPHPDQYRNLIQ